MSKIRYCVLMCCLILGAASVYAAQNDVDVKDGEGVNLGRVVVSASRNQAFVADMPQSVTVIDAEEIASSPYERVEDIVRSAPGITNFRHYALQTNGIVSPLVMRGVGKNRTLVLVDGVPQNDNFNNAIAWIGWGHIPRDTIERIEIVRGPSSALYGSEGQGGVINIVTRTPAAKRSTSIRAEGGSAQTWSGLGFHSQSFGDIGLLLAGGYEKSDGFYMTENPKEYEIKRYRDLARGLGKVTYDLGDSASISFAALYYDYSGGQGRKYFYNEMNLDQYWSNFSYDGDAVAISAVAWLNRVNKTAFRIPPMTIIPRPSVMKKWPERTHGRRSAIDGTFLEPVYITVGGAAKKSVWKYNEDYHDGGVRDAGAEGVQTTLSSFVNGDVKLFKDALVLNAGVRYDRVETADGANFDTQASAGKPAYNNTYPETVNSSISPRAGVVVHCAEWTTLRASGGKGFRNASLFELYKVHVRNGGLYYRESNPELDPETIWSWDTGIEQYITDSFRAGVTFYQSFARDYIADRHVRTVAYGPGGSKKRIEYVLDNVSEVDIHGVEAEMSWQIVEQLGVSLNYTWNVSKVKKDEANEALEGTFLANLPQHSVHGGIRYQDPRIVNISLTGNYYAGYVL
jgi:iron complex outermembrane receptor protein